MNPIIFVKPCPLLYLGAALVLSPGLLFATKNSGVKSAAQRQQKSLKCRIICTLIDAHTISMPKQVAGGRRRDWGSLL